MSAQGSIFFCMVSPLLSACASGSASLSTAMFLSGHRLQDSIEQRVEIAYLISAAPAAEDIPNEVKTLSEMLSAAGSFSATGIASAQYEEWGG